MRRAVSLLPAFPTICPTFHAQLLCLLHLSCYCTVMPSSSQRAAFMPSSSLLCLLHLSFYASFISSHYVQPECRIPIWARPRFRRRIRAIVLDGAARKSLVLLEISGASQFASACVAAEKSLQTYPDWIHLQVCASPCPTLEQISLVRTW